MEKAQTVLPPADADRRPYLLFRLIRGFGLAGIRLSCRRFLGFRLEPLGFFHRLGFVALGPFKSIIGFL